MVFVRPISFRLAQLKHVMQDESYLVRSSLLPHQAIISCNIPHLGSTVSVGIAALSHDFGALRGHISDVVHVLNAFSSSSNVNYNLVTLALAYSSPRN
jgi:hypothetical protein